MEKGMKRFFEIFIAGIFKAETNVWCPTGMIPVNCSVNKRYVDSSEQKLSVRMTERMFNYKLKRKRNQDI